MTDISQKAIKPTITIGDLEKIDIRVGTIDKRIDIEKSDKLVKLIVDFDSFQRQIVVGMKKERENVRVKSGESCQRGASGIDYNFFIVKVAP